MSGRSATFPSTTYTSIVPIAQADANDELATYPYQGIRMLKFAGSENEAAWRVPAQAALNRICLPGTPTAGTVHFQPCVG